MRRRFDRDGRVYRIDDQGEASYLYTLSLLRGIVEVHHRSTSLNIVAFSDCRSQDIGTFIAKIQEGPKPDLILYGGDDIGRFREGSRNFFEEIAALSKYGLCAVAGNDDKDANQHIAGTRVYAVHSTALVVGQFAIVGIEGAPWFPAGVGERLNIGHLLYPEPVIHGQTERWRHFARKKLIIVSHTPPYQVLDFARRFGERHIGSRPLRFFLESSTNALLCVCGHVHRCGGQDQRIGRSTVVNCASHDRTGEPIKVAYIEVRRSKVTRVEWKLIPNVHSPPQQRLWVDSGTARRNGARKAQRR